MTLDKRLGRRMVVWGLHQIPLSRGKGRLIEHLATRMAPTGSEEVVVGETTDGFKMYLRLGDNQERLIYFSGEYEHLTANVFKRVLRPGDVMVDGGANIGYYTLLSATRVGREGQVHAFEPIPDTFEALTANVGLNDLPCIRLNQMALSDQPGELVFEVPLDKETQQPIATGARQVILGDGPAMRVPATTLDDYAASHAIDHVRLVKLDLEGGEFEAIKGMQQLLGAHRIDYLIAESNTWLLEQRQMTGMEVTDALVQHGYRHYAIGKSFWGGTRIEAPTNQKYEVEEFLYVAPGVDLPIH